MTEQPEAEHRKTLGDNCVAFANEHIGGTWNILEDIHHPNRIVCTDLPPDIARKIVTLMNKRDHYHEENANLFNYSNKLCITFGAITHLSNSPGDLAKLKDGHDKIRDRAERDIEQQSNRDTDSAEGMMSGGNRGTIAVRYGHRGSGTPGIGG